MNIYSLNIMKKKVVNPFICQGYESPEYFCDRRGKRFFFVFIVTILLSIAASSCHRGNLSLDSGACYMTRIHEKTIVVRIDGICNNNLIISAFQTDSLNAEPKPLVFEIATNGKGGTLEGASLQHPAKVRWRFGQNRLVCRCRSAELPRRFTLERCETDTVRYCRQLLDSLYDVKETVDVEYARANGFWSSYPDEDKPFSAIYTERLPQLADTNVIPLCMDIYEPEDHSDAMRPLIVLIHGGAFYNGDKQDETYVKWCRHYASLGYVAVSVNYRMGFLPYKNAIDCAGFRATQDVNAAIRYLLHHAGTYRINPNWIFTWGTSAGGITALNVAFMKDGNRPKSVLQEGKIAKLNPKFTETFKIKAVANMWGAVHDTNILANSRIPVISFHGDADGIVPYGFGLPFKNMMSTFLSYQLEDQLSRLLSPSSNEWRSLLEVGFTMIYSGTEQWKERVMQPIWDKIVSPMYGSACIHEYLDRHGVRNKLFTVAGASQHSLHVDEHRNIVPYFYTIQDSVARFFYAEMVPKPVNLHQESAGSPFFRIDNTDIAEIHWQVEGGVLLEKSDNRARVVFFRDAKRHVVRVSGRYKNGVSFCEEITVA